jgi:hypothetical protein
MDAVLPLLERAFDELAPGETVLHIRRLDLRVPLAAGETAEGSESLAQLIRAQVHEQARGDQSAPADVAAPRVRRLTGADDRQQTIRAYLATGNVPWRAAHQSRAATIELLRVGAAQWWRSLLKEGPRGRSAAESFAYFARLLQLTAVADWELLAHAVASNASGPKSATLIAVFGALQAVDRTSLDTRNLVVVGAAALTRASTDVGEEELRLLATDAMRVVAHARGAAVRDSTDAVPDVAEVLFREWFGSTKEVMAVDRGRAPRRGKRNIDMGGRTSVSALVVPTVNAPVPVRALESPAVVDDRDLLAEGGMSVHYAGLILLHPFLLRLFETTGLITESGPAAPIIDVARAAAVLAAVARGADTTYEFELPFIKVLLGRDPTEPMSTVPEQLSASDRDEISALLAAVLEHWSVLRGTSADALRTGFLQRPGMLEKRDGVWNLRVQSAPFDMLLNHLPWGFGVVRLPWTATPIFTEWGNP